MADSASNLLLSIAKAEKISHRYNCIDRGKMLLLTLMVASRDCVASFPFLPGDVRN